MVLAKSCFLTCREFERLKVGSKVAVYKDWALNMTFGTRVSKNFSAVFSLIKCQKNQFWSNPLSLRSMNTDVYGTRFKTFLMNLYYLSKLFPKNSIWLNNFQSQPSTPQTVVRFIKEWYGYRLEVNDLLGSELESFPSMSVNETSFNHSLFLYLFGESLSSKTIKEKKSSYFSLKLH